MHSKKASLVNRPLSIRLAGTLFFLLARVADVGALADGPRLPVAQDSDNSPGADGGKSEELASYVKMLADPSYQRRELATRKLTDAGAEAIEPLEAAMLDGNLELIERASSILQDLALLETPDDAGQAWSSLERLQQAGPGAASTRAVSSLTLIRRERIKRAQAKLAAAGIRAGYQEFMQASISFTADMVRINDDWNGDIEVLEWLPWLYSSQLAMVEGAAVNGDVLEAISRVPSLKEIRLHDGKLDADALRKLNSMKRFDLLELHFVEIGNGDDDLFALAELPIRQQLILTGTDFDQEDYEALVVERDDLEITYSRGGFLGVQCSPGLPTCIVNQVVPGSAASRAGIIAGDIIIQLGDEKVERFEELQSAVRRFKPGENATVKVKRGVRELEFAIDLGRLD